MFRVWSHLLTLADDSGIVRCKQPVLADMAGVTLRTVIETVNRLETAGVVHRRNAAPFPMELGMVNFVNGVSHGANTLPGPGDHHG